jgi:hypothetical protein
MRELSCPICAIAVLSFGLSAFVLPSAAARVSTAAVCKFSFSFVVEGRQERWVGPKGVVKFVVDSHQDLSDAAHCYLPAFAVGA